LITLLWPVVVLADQDTVVVVVQGVCLPDHRFLLLHKHTLLQQERVELPPHIRG
jgi:hypothetical protein